MKFHKGLMIILILLFISSVSRYFYTYHYDSNDDPNQEISQMNEDSNLEGTSNLIEIMIIFVPLSWMIIIKFLGMRSERLGSMDFLTKLSNRRALEKRKSRYDIDTTSVLYLDLDNLKKINDTINHKEGDKLIVNFTDRLKSICSHKNIYRVGGDEFIIIHKGNVEPLLSKLQNVLNSEEDELQIKKFSFSAGVVVMKDLKLSSFEEAISIADYTMYEAKNSGKGNILIANQEHVEAFRLIHYIKLHLERTCQSHGFIPYFQPIIDGETGRIKGFETLVRMRIGDHFAPNDSLIKQARELNLLSMIDMQMYEESLKFARYLFNQGFANDQWIFNSNFSAHTLSRVKIEKLKAIADLYEINPNQIVIEITEDELLEKSIQTFLSSYKQYGFKIAIDDFGAAYSSFVRLLEIKPDIMKIDRSLLTMDIACNQDVKNIYNNIVHLGRDLNSTITAEGVENLEQIALLKSFGVESLQGYHFSRPVPKSEFIRLLGEQFNKA